MAAAAGGHGATLSSLLERRGRLAVALDANHRLQASLNEALEELPRCLAELSRVEAVLDLADELHNHDKAQSSLVRCDDQPVQNASLPLLPQDPPSIRRVHEELHDLREATCLPSWSKGDDAALTRCVEAECKRLAAYDASRQRLQDPLGFVASLDEYALARYALDEEDEGAGGRRGPAFDWKSIATRIAPRGSLPVHPPASCRTRWIMALQPARAKQRSAADWAPQEEKRLREIVAAQGDRIDWNSVASQLDNGSQAHDCLVAYCRLLPDEEDRGTAASQTQPPQQPTPLDDEELLRHVSIFGFEWALIAERTRKRRTAVWDRFRRALKNTNVRGTWASDELERLATAIAEQQQQQQQSQQKQSGDEDGAGRINWTLVSLAVATRTPDQCRTRWSLLGVQPAGTKPKTKSKKSRAADTPAEAGGVRQKRQQKKRVTPIPWRDDEDERLREAMKRSEQDEQQRQKQPHPVEEGGEWSWAKVADFVGSRAAWQARQRWQWLQKNEADWVAGGAKLRCGASAAKSKKKMRQETEEKEDDEEMQGEEEAEAEEDELLEGSNGEDADEDEQAQDVAEQQAVAVSLLPPTTMRGRKRKTPQRDTDDCLTAQGAASSSSTPSLRRSTRRKSS